MPKRSTSKRWATLDEIEPFKSRDEALAYLSGEKVECLICGEWKFALGTHLFRVHGVTARAYRNKMGLPLSCGGGLVGTRLKKEFSDNGKKCIRANTTERGLARMHNGGSKTHHGHYQTLAQRARPPIPAKRMNRLANQVKSWRAYIKLVPVLLCAKPGDSINAIARRGNIAPDRLKRLLRKRPDIKQIVMSR